MTKKLKILNAVLTLSIFLSPSLLAKRKVLYGADNRHSEDQSNNELHKRLAKSTAAMIENKYFISSDYSDGTVLIKGTTLEKSMNICADQKYSQIINVANCSGFLVGSDLLVTAGHCIRTELDCKNSKWVFGYGMDKVQAIPEVKISQNDVYSCSSIVNRALSRNSKNDFALVKLDREVIDREPLEFRSEGKIEDETKLVVIGHPSGLPTLIADGAKVRKNDNDFFFQANLDTFGGNSGSAVFDSETGLVEGILVRGEVDYIKDEARGCFVVKQCDDLNCRGEDVTRITVIPELAPGMTPKEPEARFNWNFNPDFDFNPGFDFDFFPDINIPRI